MSVDNSDSRHAEAQDAVSIVIDFQRISDPAAFGMGNAKAQVSVEIESRTKLKPEQTTRRMNMNNQPIEPMNSRNVHEFDIRIFEAPDLVVSVVPLHAPSNAITESWIFEMDPRGSSNA